MSPLLIAAVALFVVYVLSQFGGRIAARDATLWWASAAFMLVAALAPAVLAPVAKAFGIVLVSNFFLAAMILFLLFQALAAAAAAAVQSRKLRSVASSLAAKSYQLPLPDGAGPKVLIVLPCYNEEGSIPALVPRLERLRQSTGGRFEYVFVNDGSVDGTSRVLAELAPQRAVEHVVNCGVAGALLTGAAVVTTRAFDYLVQCDGDGQHPVEMIPELVGLAAQQHLDLAVGTRFGAPLKAAGESTTALRRLGSTIISLMLRALWPGLQCTDPTSGFRAFSRRACAYLLRTMPDEYPEPETIALLRGAGYRIGELPVTMRPRATGTSSLAGLASVMYMVKVCSALLGQKLRSVRRVSS